MHFKKQITKGADNTITIGKIKAWNTSKSAHNRVINKVNLKHMHSVYQKLFLDKYLLLTKTDVDPHRRQIRL